MPQAPHENAGSTSRRGCRVIRISHVGLSSSVGGPHGGSVSQIPIRRVATMMVVSALTLGASACSASSHGRQPLTTISAAAVVPVAHCELSGATLFAGSSQDGSDARASCGSLRGRLSPPLEGSACSGRATASTPEPKPSPARRPTRSQSPLRRSSPTQCPTSAAHQPADVSSSL